MQESKEDEEAYYERARGSEADGKRAKGITTF
jgi:hypothetical protein